jgi:para-aminobenzoate synthetase / 4-amino-4-deoxychorismate lyase
MHRPSKIPVAMATPARPDPAQGVFETLLVVAGRPLERDAHLERLGRSVKALFGTRLPDAAGELIAAHAKGLELGRLRLTAAPRGDGLAIDVLTAAVEPSLLFPGWDRAADLRGLPLEGGLGAHKWADRSLLGAPSAGGVPLLLDRGGEVLEAGWGNVFAVRSGVLETPPTDGRILPGIARAGVIEIARAEGIEVLERRLGREELLAAEEVFLTGSVRGVEPARSLDGLPLPPPGELSRRAAAGLRRRWQGRRGGGAAGPRAGERPPGRPAR